MTPRPSSAAPILAAVAIVLLPLAAYIGGYFWLGHRMDHISLTAPTRIEVIERHYSQPWLATIYQPAGKVEELLRGVDVEVVIGPSAQQLQSINLPEIQTRKKSLTSASVLPLLARAPERHVDLPFQSALLTPALDWESKS